MDGAYFATQLEYLKGNLSAVNDDLSATKGSVDTFYFITVGALVFFMQAGFGMLEAGSVRTKNTRNPYYVERIQSPVMETLEKQDKTKNCRYTKTWGEKPTRLT